MTIGEWLRLRGVELAAACFTAGLLIGGLAAGVPILLDRIPEVFFYSFCCIAAVVLRAVLDLAGRGALAVLHAARRGRARAVAPDRAETMIPLLSR
jgi:hypothetical protein